MLVVSPTVLTALAIAAAAMGRYCVGRITALREDVCRTRKEEMGLVDCYARYTPSIRVCLSHVCAFNKI